MGVAVEVSKTVLIGEALDWEVPEEMVAVAGELIAAVMAVVAVAASEASALVQTDPVALLEEVHAVVEVVLGMIAIDQRVAARLVASAVPAVRALTVKIDVETVAYLYCHFGAVGAMESEAERSRGRPWADLTGERDSLEWFQITGANKSMVGLGVGTPLADYFPGSFDY